MLSWKNSVNALAVVATMIPFTGQISYAAPATAQQATQSLIQKLNGIRSISANFNQTTQLTAKNAKNKNNMQVKRMNQNYSGIMKVARPGKFYWQTNAPAKQIIVTTGKTVWIYDPDLQQAVKQSLSAQVSNTPALLLSGNAQQIMQAYHVSQPDANKANYSLTPKNKDSAFDRLNISFSGNAPSSMVLVDTMGQTTSIRFSNVKINSGVNNSIFQFTPPKGTDIIEQ